MTPSMMEKRSHVALWSRIVRREARELVAFTGAQAGGGCAESAVNATDRTE